MPKLAKLCVLYASLNKSAVVVTNISHVSIIIYVNTLIFFRPTIICRKLRRAPLLLHYYCDYFLLSLQNEQSRKSLQIRWNQTGRGSINRVGATLVHCSVSVGIILPHI